jgi:hypothetical protein
MADFALFSLRFLSVMLWNGLNPRIFVEKALLNNLARLLSARGRYIASEDRREKRGKNVCPTNLLKPTC